MNKKQRDLLNGFISQLESLSSDLGTIRDEEQEKFDNLSEGLQQGENGKKIEEGASALDEAINNIDEAKGKIEEVRDA